MSSADIAWMLVSTALVLLMTPALAFFYGGLVRSKNALNTMMMSVAALGYTQQLPTEDRYLMTRSELLGRIYVLLGGRVAEEIVFDDVSTGAQNDLQKATEIARTMVFGKASNEVLDGFVADVLTLQSPLPPSPPASEGGVAVASVVQLHRVRARGGVLATLGVAGERRIAHSRVFEACRVVAKRRTANAVAYFRGTSAMGRMGLPEPPLILSGRAMNRLSSHSRASS